MDGSPRAREGRRPARYGDHEYDLSFRDCLRHHRQCRRQAHLVGVACGAGYEVAAAQYAYADEAGKTQLAAQSDFSASDLATGSEGEVVGRCANISALTATNLDALGEFNVTQAKLAALDKKVAAFQNLAPKPREGVAKKAAANKELKRLYTKGRGISTRRVDRLMVLFKSSAPEFYAEYRTSHKIVNPAAMQPARKAAKRKVTQLSVTTTTSKAA